MSRLAAGVAQIVLSTSIVLRVAKGSTHLGTKASDGVEILNWTTSRNCFLDLCGYGRQIHRCVIGIDGRGTSFLLARVGIVVRVTTASTLFRSVQHAIDGLRCTSGVGQSLGEAKTNLCLDGSFQRSEEH